MAVPDKWVRPTRRPADLSVGPTDLVGGPHDLLKPFRRFPRRPNPSRPQDSAYKTRPWWISPKADRRDMTRQDQESRNRPDLLANIRRTRRSLVYLNLKTNPILKQSTPTTRRRVLLFGGPNQYKLAVLSVFRVLMCDLRVLSLRLLTTEQLHHWD
jgi:hypothetical protein